jgi:endonuclease/exonuclease/phosphatase family metal-dependent hydrolase
MLFDIDSPLNLFKGCMVNKFFLALPLSIVFLFFFQSLNELMSAIYAMNFLSGVSVNGTLFFIFLPLLGPLIPMVFGIVSIWTRNKARYVPGTVLFFVIIVIAMALRLALAFCDNPARGILAGCSVFFFLMAFPFLVNETGLHGSNIAEYDAFNISASLCLAIMLKVCFTVSGNSIDLTVYPISGYFAIAWVAFAISVIAFAMLVVYRIITAHKRLKMKLDTSIDDDYEVLDTDQSVTPTTPATVEKKPKNHARQISAISDDIELQDTAKTLGFKSTEEQRLFIIRKNLAFFDTVEKQKRMKKKALIKEKQESQSIPWYKAIILGFGLMNCLTMLQLTAINPAPFSRWVDANYFTIHLVLLGSVVAFLLLVVIRKGVDVFPNLRVYGIHVVNILSIVVFTVATYFSSRMSSNLQLSNYILVIITLILTPLTIFNYQNMTYDLTSHPKTPAKLFFVSIGYIAGYAIYILLMFIASATYNIDKIAAYNLDDLYWLVPFIANLLSWAPTCLLFTDTYLYGDENPVQDRRHWFSVCFKIDDEEDDKYKDDVILTGSALSEREKLTLEADNHDWTIKYGLSHGYIFVISIIIIAFLLWGLFSFRANPSVWNDRVSTSVQFTVYNIRQGYDLDGNRVYREIYKTLKSMDSDVIALIDSDTSRLSNANEDIVRYIADKRDFYSYYGPAPTAGSKGISILSRYQIINQTTLFVNVKHEKIPIIFVELAIQKERWAVIITRLSENEKDQTIAIKKIQEIAPIKHAIIMGEFDFDPDGILYSNFTGTYEDAWSMDEFPELGTRNPYIFVSTDLEVTNSTLHTEANATSFSPFTTFIPLK